MAGKKSSSKKKKASTKLNCPAKPFMKQLEVR